MNKQILVRAGLFVGGLVIGAGVGHFVTKTRISKYYENLIMTELDQIKDEYTSLQRGTVYSSPEEAVAAKIGLDAVISENKYAVMPDLMPDLIDDNVVVIPPVHVEPITNNIFVDGVPMDPEEHNNEYVLTDVNRDKPYVISVLLYHDHDPKFDKVTLVYYEEDDVLVDETDSVIDDSDTTVGNENLRKFGEGSNDPEVVYVRNEKLSVDIEVIRNAGSYQQIVLGVQPAPKPSPRKMREGDDE